MRSPFQIFRKHQKEAIVILIGMAMLSFVFLDSLTNIDRLAPWMWVVLIAIVVAGVFWVVGTQAKKGKQGEFALWGAVAGAAIGLVVMMLNRPTAAVTTSEGNISFKQLDDMTKRRRTAIQFMAECYEAGVDPAATDMMRRQQFFEQMRATFGMPVSQPPTEKRDIVFRYILLKEAEKLGIHVSDEAIRRHINDTTKVSRAAYLRIRDKLQISEEKLFDILREELAANLAMRLYMPQFRSPPPARYWERYAKIHIKQRMEFVAVPVEPFQEKVKEPSDAELRDLFEKYRETFPPYSMDDADMPVAAFSPDPAFGVPEQIQVAYFSADYKTIEADVVKNLESEIVPADEIQETLKKIDESVANVAARIKEGKIKKEDVLREQLNAENRHLRMLLTSGRPVNRLEFEIVKQYEEGKSLDYANPDWVQQPFPTEEKPEKRKPLVAPRPKSAAPLTKDKPTGKKPAEPGDAKPSDNNGKNGKKPSEDSGAWLRTLAPLHSVAAGIAVLQPADNGKEAGNGVQLPPPPHPPRRRPAVARLPKQPFRPLDDLLRQEIRDGVLRERTNAEIRRRMDRAAAAMEVESRKYFETLDGDSSFDAEAASKRLEAKADELRLQYVVTKLLSPVEFANHEDHPLADTAQMFEFSSQEFIMGARRRVFQILFGRPDSTVERSPQQLFKVIRAAEVEQEMNFQQFQGLRINPSNIYVLWKLVHNEARVPEFTDEGVREKVLEAWKRSEARPLAEKRAKAVAEEVRKARRPMADALESKTITGDAEARLLRPTEIREPVSWLTMFRDQSSAPQLGMPEEELIETPLVGVERPGDDFRRYVFETLKDGEIGVTANADQSIYYVVRVLDRRPTTTEALKLHMEQMLSEDPFGVGASPAFADIADPFSPVQQRIRQSVENKLFDRYNVHISKDETNENEDVP